VHSLAEAAKRPLASIAAMPGRTSSIAIAAVIAALGLAGCGGDDDPEPSIPVDSASTLVSTLQRVQDNVDVGSCLVAEREVQQFQSEVDALPSDVNQEVIEALQRGSQNLIGLLEEDCEDEPETTTEETTTETTTNEPETTTEETTTEETTQPTEPTTETQPTTTTTTEPPPDVDGGIGPPGDGL
jgi:outer membrane murein-binding lipoprotein Lpp